MATATTVEERHLDSAMGKPGSVLSVEEPDQAHFHRVVSMFSGAASGLFGLPGRLLELPISTTIMMRAIAEVARHHGEDPSSLETRMACLEVFALGGRSEQDDAAETGYYGTGLALALVIRDALHHVNRYGSWGDSVPAA